MSKLWGLILIIWCTTVFAEKKEHPELNTAAAAPYLSPLEKEVIYEINLFRSDPADYARKYIAPLAKHYDRKILHYPGDKAIQTFEGVNALNECVRELKRMSAKPFVNPDPLLTRAAEDHQRDQQKNGRTGHTGNDRSDLKQRIERYGKWQTRIGENIAYGNSSARQIVVFLLIDDGVHDRGHRATLLNPDFKVVGVACGLHPVYETMCVLDFAGGISKK